MSTKMGSLLAGRMMSRATMSSKTLKILWRKRQRGDGRQEVRAVGPHLLLPLPARKAGVPVHGTGGVPHGDEDSCGRKAKLSELGCKEIKDGLKQQATTKCE